MKKSRILKDTITRINKIGNVEWDKSKGQIQVDELTKRIYRDVRNEVSMLEGRYNLNLSKYRDRLYRDYTNLKNEVKNLNKEPNRIADEDFIELNYQSFKLNQIEDMIRNLNPNRKSEPFKKESLDLQKLSQLENSNIADIETEYWTELTELDSEDIKYYLYPDGEEEESWYEQYLSLVDGGYEEEEARIIANEWYEEHTPRQIASREFYNMDDIIKETVPKSKQKQAKRYLDNVTAIRLLNLGE